MKTIISFLLIALITTSAFTASAGTIADANFTMNISGQTLLLQTAQWNQSDLNVQIKDEEGRTIFDQTYKITEATKIKKYNLSRLSEGTYKIVLSNELRTSKQNITKKDKGILIDPMIETYFKPQISVLGKQLKVNYLNLDHQSTLKILDPNHETIYEALIDHPGYNQQFNLSKLDRGSYTLLVTQGNERFIHSFNLD